MSAAMNERAKRLTDRMLADASGLGLVTTVTAGATIIDAGVKAAGGISAGLALARVCLSDLGEVSLVPGPAGPLVQVSTDHAVAACLASQYAGWQVNVEGWFGMGSGPMRAKYGKEPLFDDIGLREPTAQHAVGVLESGKLPTAAVVHFLCERLEIAPAALTLWVARTKSLAGLVQVVARSVEVALHQLHELKYDLSTIRSAYGFAPVPAAAPDDLTALGRTNDAILAGGRVQLFVDAEDDLLVEVGPKAVAAASPDFGTPFLELFKQAGNDFYKMDPRLFAPAELIFHNQRSGRTHPFGRPAPDVLRQCFGVD